MTDTGYLVIADITGYTEFLTQTELTHAHETLDTLFGAILDNIKAPLQVAKLEGDAVFAYSPDGSVAQGQTLLEMLEDLYVAFARAQEQMEHNTTCDCGACALIPRLDLKIVLHHGEYLLRDIGGYRELAGSDVILVHRLAKNSVIKATGIHGYALITQAAAEALPLGNLATNMPRHSETYEHLGEVQSYIHDLGAVWQQNRDLFRVAVEPEQAWFAVDVKLPISPALAWDYAHAPEHKKAWTQSDKIALKLHSNGRVGAGAVHICTHGDQTIAHTIVDWRPFEYATFDVMGPLNANLRYTIRLTPAEDGTLVSWLWATLSGENPLKDSVLHLMSPVMRAFLQNNVQQAADLLSQKVNGELAQTNLLLAAEVA